MLPPLNPRLRIPSWTKSGFDIPLKTPAQKFIIWIMAGMIYLSTLDLIGGIGVWHFLQHQSVLTSSHVSMMMILLFSMLAIIALICILIVAFITHSGLIIHRQLIESLQLLGAKDRFIARQFQTHTTNIALKAALLGGGGTALTFILIKPSLQALNWRFVENCSLINEVWFIIGFVPFLMIVTVLLTTRLTALLVLQEDGNK